MPELSIAKHLPWEDCHSFLDFCVSCGHNHFPVGYKEKHKARHCSIEGCKCLSRSFVGRKAKGRF